MVGRQGHRGARGQRPREGHAGDLHDRQRPVAQSTAITPARPGPLREGKGTCWEGGVRVPCIMRWPGKIPAGATSGAMLMTIDLLPTIAGRVGAELPAHTIDGLDVWPLLAGEPGATNPHDAYLYYYEQNQLQAVVSGDGRWKLQLPHTYRSLAGHPGGHGGSSDKI